MSDSVLLSFTSKIARANCAASFELIISFHREVVRELIKLHKSGEIINSLHKLSGGA